MKHRLLSRRTPVVLLAVLCIVALLVPLAVQAAPPAARDSRGEIDPVGWVGHLV